MPTLEIRCEPVDVTSMNRPDTAWRFTDAQGHLHQWHANGTPAEDYSPSAQHSLPTLEWVETAPATDDYPALGYHRCIHCHERIEPRGKADDCRMFIPGLKQFYLDGVPISADEAMAFARDNGYDG